MDFEKILEFATEYLSDYISVFVETLRKPTSRFQLVLPKPDSENKTIVLPQSEVGNVPQLNPKLLGFVIISIFIGSTVNALVPDRQYGPDFATTAVIVVSTWFFYSSIMHMLCIMLGGKGTLIQTLSVSFQLLAVLYVVSSVVALLVGTLLNTLKSAASFIPLDGLTDIDPVTIYFVVQFMLLFVYLPIALKYAHSFGTMKRIIIGVLAPVSVVPIGFSIYMSQSILISAGPSPISFILPIAIGIVIVLVYELLSGKKQ